MSTKKTKATVVANNTTNTINMSKYSPVNTIYETMDYNDFAFVNGNRHISREHVSKFKTVFNLVGWIPEPIVTVYNMSDGKFYIIEGQHRYTAAKELNIPILFSVHTTAMDYVDVCRIVNTCQQSWSLEAIVTSQAECGSANAMWFENLLSTNKTLLTRNAIICMCRTDGERASKGGKAGGNISNRKFVESCGLDGLSQNTINAVNDVVNWLQDFKPFVGKFHIRKDIFIDSLLWIRQTPNVTKTGMINTLKNHGANFALCYELQELFIRDFDKLYNKHNKSASAPIRSYYIMNKK